MIFNTQISGLDEASFLIVLGFPFSTVSKIETVDLESQTRANLPDRLSWNFGNVSARGESVKKYRQWFKLPEPSAPAVHLAQRARIAACNYQALKDSLLNQSPLTQKTGSNWTLLKNHEGKMLPRMHGSPSPAWCRTTAAVAIACAFGARLEAYAHIGGLLYAVPAPSAPGEITPSLVESVYLSSAPADPTDYSELSVLCAMFIQRAELLRVAGRTRRLSLHHGRKNALISSDASPALQDSVFRFLTNGR